MILRWGIVKEKIFFKISYCYKQYTRGDKVDIFYLSKPDLLASASYFNSLGGEDIMNYLSRFSRV
ncbi:hypothetical protein [Candidatus Williamhamiltonella defendens]|uniref:hypothetical protein n=1 Tax=Candidatus Williamhamiltonella defendens TaxID=138072 RepID=UPI00130EAD24|nr:hypothetical protein [Candidatus Hamiltonella defensa]